MPQGRQGICRFPGLGNGDKQCIFRYYRIAVAVFTGHFHHARNAGKLFQLVTSNQPGVIACAAGNNMYLPDFPEHFTGADTENIGQNTIFADAAFQRFRYRRGLLEYFFLHVMTVLAALHGVRCQICFPDRAGGHLVLAIPDLVSTGIQPDNIPFFEIYKTVGHRKQGEGI